MSFIPTDKTGRQAYAYDTRDWKAKLQMWFWKRFSKKIRGKNFFAEHITGEKTVYRNCVFKHCRFDGLRLVFIVDCYIEHGTDRPEFSNLRMCEINKVVFKKVKPLIE